MADRCRWEHDEEIGPWHLPGCWGAIMGGPEGCICEGMEEEDGLDGRLARMEYRIRELEAAVKKLTADD
jgi:hypothetical protein